MLEYSVFLAWLWLLVIGLTLLFWPQKSVRLFIYTEKSVRSQYFHVHFHRLRFRLWWLLPSSFRFWIVAYFMSSVYSTDLCPTQISTPWEDWLCHLPFLISKMVGFASSQVLNLSNWGVAIPILFLVGSSNSLQRSRVINICFAVYPMLRAAAACSHRQILPWWNTSTTRKYCFWLLLWNTTRALSLCFQCYAFPKYSDPPARVQHLLHSCRLCRSHRRSHFSVCFIYWPVLFHGSNPIVVSSSSSVNPSTKFMWYHIPRFSAFCSLILAETEGRHLAASICSLRIFCFPSCGLSGCCLDWVGSKFHWNLWILDWIRISVSSSRYQYILRSHWLLAFVEWTSAGSCCNIKIDS